VKDEDTLSNRIIACAIEVHRTLGGPGLLECVYEEALAWEINNAGMEVKRQVELPIIYKNQNLGHSLRIDMVVNNRVIIECKATSQYNPLFESQILTYLRLTELKLGMVLNFGQGTLKDGIHRVVNNL
jgi:GxxExxY protein